MLKNILLLSLRVLTKQAKYSLINLFGLAVGLTTSITIFLFVQDELSYDKYHENANNIYRLESYFVYEGEVSHWAATQGSFLPAVASRYPEVVDAVKFRRTSTPIQIRYEDKKFSEANLIFADTTFFEVFSYEVVAGETNILLNEPKQIIVSESIAKKYFGNENPIGKVLNTEKNSYAVSSVIKDIPENSHFHFDMVIPLNDIRTRAPYVDVPGPSVFYSYLQLDPKASLDKFIAKVDKDIYEIYGYTTSGDSANVPTGLEVKAQITPILDIHLHSNAEKEFQPNGNIQTVYILSVIAFFMIIIAAINYMNLATAKSMKRAREVGMRKVLGANRFNIFSQFMTESLIMTTISGIAALAAVYFILPSFNEFTGKNLVLDLFRGDLLGFVIISIIVLVGFVSGIYPAVFLSGFQPLKVLKSDSSKGNKNTGNILFRRILVVTQFAISVFLIIGVLTVNFQMAFISSKNLGVDKEKVLVVKLPGRGLIRNFEPYKTELLKLNDVKLITSTASVPGTRMPFLSVRVPELAKQDAGSEIADNGERSIRTFCGDFDMLRTFGIKVDIGRDFTQDISTDAQSGFILNEAAVKEFGFEDNPIGRPFEYTYAVDTPKVGTIIGVVKDFNYASLHNVVEPLMMHIFPRFDAYVSIKLNTGNIGTTIGNLKSKWNELLPEIPFDYFFLDEAYNKLYKAEMNMSEILNYFTLIAILIACLGLFGLASFVAEQKTKEIGIRKTLGAPTNSIILLLSKEFMILVSLANFVAWVPAYYYLSEWLNGFAYRVDINFEIFIASFLIAIIIAMLTVSFRTYIAANTDPVKALRHE